MCMPARLLCCVAEVPPFPLQVLQHMKAVQADQERERQRRLEVERGRWSFLW